MCRPLADDNEDSKSDLVTVTFRTESRLYHVDYQSAHRLHESGYCCLLDEVNSFKREQFARVPTSSSTLIDRRGCALLYFASFATVDIPIFACVCL